MSVEQFLDQLSQQPTTVEFDQLMTIIEQNYQYTPTTFTNGLDDKVLVNESGVNQGSCKLFAFAKLNNLSKQQTLDCFGQYYREDVLKNPKGDDHGNIRNFITYGWDGIQFNGEALSAK